MSMITESDEGKSVVRDDTTVGIVATVEHGTAYVEPDPSLTDKVMSQLGWKDIDEETFPLQDDEIADVTDDEIRLQTSR
ncbi:PRC-barrel domain containing protein [Halocatena pleomorpha]|uniref:PRC-barrel domain containing protein n=1 Tax=Halocatena pleomorpha TaxID=1785090 RepID=A0A3P3R891_9EURY|nr:PRC-barrel domain containing protein [Halocatena pleomorpha]RRJ29692.1 PRC-barrel domain containing protein [Halocatena pleomorpha]